jgi:hypothetical protein
LYYAKRILYCEVIADDSSLGACPVREMGRLWQIMYVADEDCFYLIDGEYKFESAKIIGALMLCVPV